MLSNVYTHGMNQMLLLYGGVVLMIGPPYLNLNP